MRLSLLCVLVSSVFIVAAEEPVTPGSGVTVQGHVIRPGVYPFLPHDTIKTALGESGGLMKGWLGVAYVYRTDVRGVSRKIEIPLGKILRGRSSDVELQPGDVLDVPFPPGASPKNRPDVIDVPISPPGERRS